MDPQSRQSAILAPRKALTMAITDDLCSILEDLKKSAGELETKTVVFDFDDQGTVKTVVQDQRQRLDDYNTKIQDTWMREEQALALAPSNTSKVVSLNEDKRMWFLPLLLTESWLPLKGSPIKYQRINRGVRISSVCHYHANDQPIGLPSGLLARRILLALVTRAVIEKNRVIDVTSVSELLRETGLTKSGRQIRRIQQTLFQLFMCDVKIWGEKEIHSGQMFDFLGLDVEETRQEKFSFIPKQVVFQEAFYRDVIDGHSAPFLAGDLLKAKGALEHDVLIWLLNRQTKVSKRSAQFIGYGLLFNQFGQPGQSFKHFKSDFKKLMRVIQERHQRQFEITKSGILLSFMPSRVKAKQERKIWA